ncbi:MAG: UDP-4-amino-4-deoxy-L-arabinose--oxoglutarate aminotransferase [Methanomassiliicoccales archaeon PtaB.Bin215]|nr:MAG: UDP-4-amino-4-deoxy-L-arabinose--oxoglutarate aminotransferase [Methanomassiliicoccales archaeon PtaB.Bin215]
MKGFTSRLNTCNAAIGLVQLKRLDGWNERRRAIADRYLSKLRGVADLGLPPKTDSVKLPVYHCFAINTDRRDELAQHLGDRGIATAVHYPIPIHKQPAYTDDAGHSYRSLPVSERLAERILSLPLFPTMTDEQVDRVCDEVIHFLR